MTEKCVEIVTAGLLTSVQDLGRAGYAGLGVGAAGAADRPVLRLANALVGNPDGAAALEFTLNGPTLHFLSAVEIALGGASFAADCDGHPVPMWSPVRLAAGAVLRIHAARTGCRGYLALAGGVAVAPILGSRSQDLNAGLGPWQGRPLRTGDVLPLNTPTPSPSSPPTDARPWALAARCWTSPQRPAVIHLLPGSHQGALDEASSEALFSTEFHVSRLSNRVGCRLDGATLKLQHPLELISEGVVPGTVQLPPGGQPIVLLCEAPVTGGYPRIGHVTHFDASRVAQLRPGDGLRFVAISAAQARAQGVERETAIQTTQWRIAKRRQGRWP
ncbi:MAG TPA: biotin-dependent carboxyltransferase family protein [Nevskiaceae bacterium]|nr:biotin-dependent carboxyltransferase family protein [Nevskiaceae bacterium]